MMKKSYRLNEAADHLGVSQRTVERLIQRGQIQSFTVCDTRTRRIEAEELERMKKKEQSGSA